MDNGKMTQKEKANFILKLVGIICGTFILLCLIAVIFGNNNNNNTTKDCKLCFKVTTSENIDEDCELDVKLIGKNNDGDPVNETYSAKLNQVYDIKVKSGEYTMYVDVISLNTSTNIFKSFNNEFSIHEDKSDVIELKFELDKDAMAKKQAELNTQQQSQNQQQAQNGGTGEVLQEYVIVTTTGKFHLATCRTLSKAKPGNKQVVQSTYSQLVAQGYVPCKVCLG